jgi:hypothetical protein
MEVTQKNGNSGDVQKIDPNGQGHVFAITEDEAKQATDKGNEYNLNSGTFSITGSRDNAVLYFKSDEDDPFVITGIAFWIGVRTATVAEHPLIKVIKNPTAGAIISPTPTDADMNSNTNFSSNASLKSTSVLYKGATGDTFTDGSEHAVIGTGGEGRGFASLNIELKKGASVGLTIDIGTSGAASVYGAFVGYLKDPNNTPK